MGWGASMRTQRDTGACLAWIYRPAFPWVFLKQILDMNNLRITRSSLYPLSFYVKNGMGVRVVGRMSKSANRQKVVGPLKRNDVAWTKMDGWRWWQVFWLEDWLEYEKNRDDEDESASQITGLRQDDAILEREEKTRVVFWANVVMRTKTWNIEQEGLL